MDNGLSVHHDPSQLNNNFKEFVSHDDHDVSSSPSKLSKTEPHKKSVTKINILDDGESSVHVHYPNPVAKTKAKVNPIKKPERRKSLDVAALMTKAEQASHPSKPTTSKITSPAKLTEDANSTCQLLYSWVYDKRENTPNAVVKKMVGVGC